VLTLKGGGGGEGPFWGGGPFEIGSAVGFGMVFVGCVLVDDPFVGRSVGFEVAVVESPTGLDGSIADDDPFATV
jgi:hypothetical protein